MFSGNFGANWDIVARDVHPPGSDEYTRNDFVWLAIINATCSCTYYVLYTRGEPGIDWNIDNPSQGDLTKVFYNVYATDESSISGSSDAYVCCVCMCTTNRYVHISHH